MKSKIVEEQLNKCSFADLSCYDKNTNTYHIPKYSRPRYELGKCYLVKLPKEIVKNPMSVLATNWNNSTAPQFEYLKIYVNKVLGKNIQVDSLAYNMETKEDINVMWSGWLPTEEITQIQVL